MHWIVLSPFHDEDAESIDAREASGPAIRDGWLLEHIPPGEHRFTVVGTVYSHDRSRPNTSFRQWLDYARHALRGRRAAKRCGAGPVGFIAVFPQLAVMLGLLKRLGLIGTPVIAWCFNLGRVYHGVRGWLASFGLSSVDAFIVHSQAEIATYSTWIGLPKSRFRFVPLSVAQPAFKLSIKQEPPFILAMGTANRDYGVLLNAIRNLPYQLRIVCGPHAIEGLEIPPNVEVRSGLSTEQCGKLCGQARLVVVPLTSGATASGQVTILEAMMLGKPVIATRSTGTVDYIEHGRTGVLVEPGDPAALRDAIDDLWLDDEKRHSIGAAAQLCARAQFGFPAAAMQLKSVLDAQAQGSVRRPRFGRRSFGLPNRSDNRSMRATSKSAD